MRTISRRNRSRLRQGLGAGSIAPAWSIADLAAGVALRYHPGRSATTDLGPTNSGAGAVASGGTGGWWRDAVPTADPRAADPAVQATSGRRPVVTYHAKGKGFSVNGSGGAGAGGNFLAGGAALTGAKTAFVVAHAIGPDVGRSSSANPANLFNDNFHGFVGTAPVSFSANFLTGDNGLGTWIAGSIGTFKRDGVVSNNAGYGRTRYIFEAVHTSTADSGVLNLLRFVGSDAYYARGGLSEVLCASATMTTPDHDNIYQNLSDFFHTGPIVAIVGDSNGASFGDGSGLSSVVKETESLAASIHETYGRTIDVPCIAVPGQGLSASVAPLTQTMLADDPAKLATVRRRHTPPILLIVAGTNDLWNGRTAAQVRTDLETYVAARQAEGWKCIVTTICQRAGSSGWTGGAETYRASFNTALRADHAFADGFVDIDTINPGLQGDNVHFSVAGVAAVAASAITVIGGLLP